jgi:lipid-A-disaccharide synthase
MRVFFGTGELSGEALAADLLGAMRTLAPIDAEGVGDERLASAGVRIVQRNRGWASIGPVEALRHIPKLTLAGLKLVAALRRDPPDLVVLVDYGAFHARLAALLRFAGFPNPIVYYAPPGAWFDNVKRARAVAGACDALTFFRHQAEFYRAHGLPIGYIGHPLVSLIAARPPRDPAPASGGLVALLPGSRRSELERHAPILLDAFALLRERRPEARALAVAANDDAEAILRAQLASRSALPVEIVRDARAALREVDAAAVASGTAVLEAALVATPSLALYTLTQTQLRFFLRFWKRPYVTLPNLVLGEAIVPELLQHHATPARIAETLETLLDDPRRQLADYARLREALGPPDSLQRNAQWVLDVAAERR